MQVLPSSLSARLLAVFVITAIAAIMLMSALFFRGLGSQWQRAIVPHLVQYVAYLKDDLGAPPDEQRARKLASVLPIQIQAHDRMSGELLFTTRDKPIDVNKVRFSNPRQWRRLPKRAQQQLAVEGFDNIVVGHDRRHPILRLETDEYRLYIEFAGPRERKHGIDELLFALLGLTLLLSLCFLTIRHLLKPIGRLQNTVVKISEGDLSARTQAKGHDDLARLSQSVDEMSGRIQQMLDAKRELLLAISHELRSPITRARVAAELLEPSRHQNKLIADLDEMESLIAQLIESERLQTHVVLDLQELELIACVKKIVSTYGDSVNLNTPEGELFVSADVARIELLIRNLIVNAQTYGKHEKDASALVEVRVWAALDQIKISVIDQGPGIAEAHLASVTEAFYRPDASRDRKTGGVGLGLYLCKRIAQAHGGTLSVVSPYSNDCGTAVIVTLPYEPPS